MTSSEPAFRSLGADDEPCPSSAAYGDRLGGQGAGSAKFPLEAKHLSEQLIEDARALVGRRGGGTARKRGACGSGGSGERGRASLGGGQGDGEAQGAGHGGATLTRTLSPSPTLTLSLTLSLILSLTLTLIL